MAIEQQHIAPLPWENPVPVSDNGCRSGTSGFDQIIAASKSMRKILEVVQRSAPTDVPVLIYGEPDTGKKLIAFEVHRRSRRATGSFVHVTCSGLRESDLAEKLFGRSERGTGQDNQTPQSILEEARGGTLFLEDVSQLPLWGQVRLLEVLQQERHSRGAGLVGTGVDVRVIASSTVDLATAVAQRVFLSSLYYYLKVVEIHVPPLRYRSQDLCVLAQDYLAIANATRARQGGKAPCHFAKEALQRLVEYDWPGNTLQLSSTVAHAALLTEGDEISPMQITELLGEAIPRTDSETISVPLAGGLKEIERAVVAAVIQRCSGNKAAAAQSAGVAPTGIVSNLAAEGPGERQRNTSATVTVQYIELLDTGSTSVPSCRRDIRIRRRSNRFLLPCREQRLQPIHHFRTQLLHKLSIVGTGRHWSYACIWQIAWVLKYSLIVYYLLRRYCIITRLGSRCSFANCRIDVGSND